MKRTAKSVIFLNDDGYDSDNLKRIRLHPGADEAYKKFLKENNMDDPESSETEIIAGMPSSAASMRAEPLEAPERVLEDRVENKESQPKATKKRKKLNSSDEEWAPKTGKSKDENEAAGSSKSKDPVTELRVKFPKVPRGDITRSKF